MLRRVVIGSITYHVEVVNGAGRCCNGWDFNIGVCVYVDTMHPITMDVRRAEALAEIGRGERLA